MKEVLVSITIVKMNMNLQAKYTSNIYSYGFYKPISYENFEAGT